MFFGHEVKANKNKPSLLTPENDIKLSQAVLDPASKGSNKEPVTLIAEVEGKSFILAVLDPSQSWQCSLDLMLAAGTVVKFYLKGKGCVHLTGYEFRDDDFDMSMSSDDEEEEEEEPGDAAKLKQVAKKIKTKNSPPKTNGIKANHKPPNKIMGGDTNSDDDSDDSDDDEDLSFGSEEEDLDSSNLDETDSSNDAMDQDVDSDDDDDEEDEKKDDDDSDDDSESN